jgi:ligand-binding sensor domain-containing protein/signal transduction histidine kinase
MVNRSHMLCRPFLQMLPGCFAGVLVGASASAADVYGGAESLPQYRVSRWVAENGLPQNTIKALVQTPDGYLWFGTLKGLARFDGVRFEVFDHSNTPELASDAIDEMAADPVEGSLWLRAGDSIVRYRDHQFEAYGPEQGFPENKGALWAGRAGRVWCQPRPGQLGLIERGHIRLGEFGPDSGTNHVLQVEEETPSQVLVLLARGLFRFNIQSGSWANLTVPSEGRHYNCILRDTGDSLWLCADEGIWHGTEGNWIRQSNPDPAQNGRPMQVLVTKEREHWFRYSRGRQGSQLQRLVSGRMEPFTLPEIPQELEITRLLEDQEGNLWIGTSTGLFRLQRKRLRVYAKHDGLTNDNTVACMEGPDGAIWLGTGEGVSVIAQGKVMNLPPPPGEAGWGKISTLLVDRRNRLWVGTRPRVLSRYEKGRWRYVDAPAEASNTAFLRTLYEDRQGRLWLSTGTGVLCQESKGWTYLTRTNGLSNPDVRVIFQDRRGDMWFGTFGGGLNRLHEGQITSFATARGPRNNRAWWIHEDTDGVFWVGSEDGLNRFEPPEPDAREPRSPKLQSQPGRFFTFTKEQGLSENVINNIQEDESGYLWMSGLQGIQRVSRQQLNQVALGKRSRVQSVTFGEADGMLNSECNGGDDQPSGCRDRQGRIWFPTAQGVAMINPKQIVLTEEVPPALIEQVKANDKVILGDGFKEQKGGDSASKQETTTGSEYRLAPGHARVLAIRYTANNLSAGESVRFKCRLLGQDAQWRDAGEGRTAFYTNLRPGNYRFEVMAANAHGVWGTIPAQFSFSIGPHFWETWSFYVVCGCAVLGIGGVLQSYRLRWQRRLLKVDEQRALASQRARIARDLHDDLGTALTGVALQLEVARREAQQSPTLAQRLGDTARYTRELAERMREVVWTVNPRCDTVLSLANFLEQQVAQFLRTDAVRVRLQFPEHIPELPLGAEARHQLALSVREALTNVVRHAKASEVVLALEIKDGQLAVKVSDNGCGLNGAEPNGHGLENMQTRMAQVGGTFECVSNNGSGTVVTFRLPLTGPVAVVKVGL